jgi:hypothetical protein
MQTCKGDSYLRKLALSASDPIVGGPFRDGGMGLSAFEASRVVFLRKVMPCVPALNEANGREVAECHSRTGVTFTDLVTGLSD